ncbi:dTDP-4-dehydrorhamnose 3,5-epimerase [Terribacillus saccharophilus]|uniref:dTDP-4-dehydrorhamnose 3,5-epimerase n=1 Tax=Terribacillus saccharophilus TaxID=361277 RepID=UPI002989CF38|nr:dTDP-4-dehydrorhamnose 3,5-epimerase [Terribacillus saccharophilus]MCM3225241.1 dTDP-4-dehydrorhamnose 3,5-epimerase [Terribacillus saccharophilus]
MKVIDTSIQDIKLLEPKVFGDNRGWFLESFNKSIFDEVFNGYEFIQDNHSFSAKRNTLRGLHFQNNPMAQAKLVRCSRGKIFDVAVDIRKSSSTFGQWIGVELSEENKKQLFIPEGFAHGFLTLTDNVEIQYKVNQYYSPDDDRSILWNDPEIGISWPLLESEDIILSIKDKSALTLSKIDNNFI